MIGWHCVWRSEILKSVDINSKCKSKCLDKLFNWLYLNFENKNTKMANSRKVCSSLLRAVIVVMTVLHLYDNLMFHTVAQGLGGPSGGPGIGISGHGGGGGGRGNSVTNIYSGNVENSDRLIVTPYITRGEIDLARNLSRVSNFTRVQSYAGFFNVHPNYNSNLFFWFFPAAVSDDPDNICEWS